MSFDITGGLTSTELTGFHEGHDHELWRRLGASVITVDSDDGPIEGTRFSVWAPNAQEVRLAGPFNFWNSSDSHLHRIDGTGVWSRFLPGVGSGELYKFDVLGADGVWRQKADPMARFCEAAPENASIVYDSGYAWNDDQWMWYRGQRRPHEQPMSVYEVHLGSWRQGLSYLQLADQLVEYMTWQGYTHVEFLPVAEHPYLGSWGYHVTGFYAPQSRFGSPDEFRHLVDRLHQAGIGVIVDWVPGHFATDPWALERFDGTALYEHPDPRRGWHPDWGSYIFDFGRPEVKSFLVSNAYWWIEDFHVDGLRVDAVASMLYLDYSRGPGEWEPNKHGGNQNLEAIALLQEVNSHVYKEKAGVVMIAEESTSYPGVTRPVAGGGLGFGLKWNMGWMNDSLRYVGRDPIHRQHHHHEMTFAMAYAYSENFVLPISHDEVVHGKGSMYERMPQDPWRKFATLRAYYAYMWAHPGKQLLFMGTEFAQEREFSESRSLDWELCDAWGHRGVQRLVKDMNGIYADTPALWKLDSDPAGFRWINADDQGGNVFSWLRFDGDGEMIACVTNFATEARQDYQIGLPVAGVWKEILNTDADTYDGSSSFGNLGEVVAGEVPWRDFPCTATVTVPPLGAVWLRYEPSEDPASTGLAAEEIEPTQSAAARAGSPRTQESAPTTKPSA